MPSSESVPHSRDEWLARLQPLLPPVDAAVRDDAINELNGGRGSAASLARLLLADPAQVLLLFSAADQALARYERFAHTLEHAISLLGVGRVQQLLEQATALPADHPHAQDYRQALLRSQHAAWQARMWAEGSGRWPADEVFWSTLLAAAPRWLLWLEAGPQMHQLELLRARQGAVSHAQQRALFGCTLAELGAALAEHWQLPEMSRLSWRPEAAGTARQWVGLEHAARLEDPPVVPDGPINELCHHPALVVAAANALAEEADWDWYSRRCLRLLNIAASACRRPLSTLLTYSHQTAAALSREYAQSGLLTPGTRLLCRWHQGHFLVPPKKSVEVPAAERDRVLAGAVKRLRQPDAGDNPRSILEFIVSALQRGLGLDRVAVLLYRGGSRELHTAFSAGAEQNAPLRQLRCNVQDNALLNQMLGKPVCLQVNAGNRAKFWPHFPAAFRNAVESDTFLLMSILTGARPLGLVYADNKNTKQALSERQQQLFKQLCQQLALCLEQLSGRAG